MLEHLMRLCSRDGMCAALPLADCIVPLRRLAELSFCEVVPDGVGRATPSPAGLSSYTCGITTTTYRSLALHFNSIGSHTGDTTPGWCGCLPFYQDLI